MSTQKYTFDRYAKVHENPTGAGDSRPTALQIVRDNNLEGQHGNKVMLVTGANAGIGTETSKALAATGAKLFLGVRSLEKGQKLIADIEAAQPISKGRLELVLMDMLSLESIRTAAKDVLSRTDTLNVLVNNAGVALTPKSTTPDGFDNMFQVNYLSHFLLFQLLKPLLLKSSSPAFQSRVVNVSSEAHRMSGVDFDDINWTKRDYHPAAAYGSSKTAMVWMTNEIERRYAVRGLHGLSVHPGGILSTNISSTYDPNFLEDMAKYLKTPGLQERFKSNEQGAATTVVAAVERDLEAKGGIYLEDCGTAVAHDEKTMTMADPGYAAWAFDEAGEKRLWEESCKFVNVDN